MNDQITRTYPLGFLPILICFMLSMVGFALLQSLLVLYATSTLGFSDELAESSFTAYFSLIFGVPLLGGYLGSRFFGYKFAVVFGFIIAIAGLLFISMPFQWSYYTGMACFIMGVSCYVPNLWVLLGRLYSKNDPRREMGFTIIYLGFNFGSFAAFSASGFLQVSIGYQMTFVIGAVFSLFALLSFVFFKHHIKESSDELETQPITLKSKVIGCLVTIAMLPILVELLDHPQLNNILLVILGVLVAFYIIYLALREKTKARNRLLIFLILCIVAIVFWAVYVLAPTALTLFIERNVDRHVFDWIIPASSIMSLNSFFIIIIGLPLSYLWLRLSHANKGLSIPAKFAIAVMLMGFGYLIIYPAISNANVSGYVALYWIVISYFLQTLAELFISPIGYSMVGKLVPKHLEGFMMGYWQLATGIGAAITGFLDQSIHLPKDVVSPLVTNSQYADSFGGIGLATFIIGVIVLLLVPILRRKMI